MSVAITKQFLELEGDHTGKSGFKKGKIKKSSKEKKIRKKEVKTKTRKAIIDDHMRAQAEDHTEKSLIAFQAFSKSGKSGSNITKMILDHNRGKLSKNNKLLMQKKEEKEPKSIFSDDDFKNFEKEYNFL